MSIEFGFFRLLQAIKLFESMSTEQLESAKQFAIVSRSFDLPGDEHCQVEVSLCSNGVPQTTFAGKPSAHARTLRDAIDDAFEGKPLNVSELQQIINDFTIFFQLYAWCGHYDAFCALAYFIKMPEPLQDYLAEWCEGFAHIVDRLKRVQQHTAHLCIDKLNVCAIVEMRMYAEQYTQTVDFQFGRKLRPDDVTLLADISRSIDYQQIDCKCPISASRCAFKGDLENLRNHSDDAFTKDVLVASIAGGGKCEEYVRERMCI